MSIEDMADREIDRLHDEIAEQSALTKEMGRKLTEVRDLAGMAQAAADRLPNRPGVVYVEEILGILNSGEFLT